nr:unnamed protein product [Digitaria exilis]
MMGKEGAPPITGGGGGAHRGAFAFISKGWREVRDSATADLRLMRARADSVRARADRELEHLLASASALAGPAPPLPPVAAGAPIAEVEFVRKRIQPKIEELRRQYSSRAPGGGWPPGASTLRVDLSGITAIRNAIMAEGDGADRWRLARWKGERDEEGRNEWEVVRMIRSGLKEFERRSRTSDMFAGFRGRGEFVEKFKLSLKSLNKDCRESKEVPPLDLTEIVAYLLRQSGPFLDQLGIRRDLCDKLVEMLYSKRNGQLMYDSLSEDRALAENTIDDLDLRIARVLESTGYHRDEGFWNDPAKYKISDNRRHVAIVTTASLPWMTGTAINPLFRAAYLARSEKQKVTLVVPWLCKSDQELVYPNNITFGSPEEQETYIRNWLQERLGFEADFKISFYPGKFSKERRRIIPAGDTSQFISSKEADIAILEEPEHLNWYHHGKRWTDKFNHVIGVVHKNYLEYIKREKNGAIQSFLVKHINNWVTRAYCHKVLCLEEFVARVKEAMASEPQPLTPEQRYSLSWEAATERFMEYSELNNVLNNTNGHPGLGAKIKKLRKKPLLPKLSDVVDGGLAFAHHCLTGNEILRLATGAIPGTRDYDKQQCMDLNLLPPQVQHPVYGW